MDLRTQILAKVVVILLLVLLNSIGIMILLRKI